MSVLTIETRGLVGLLTDVLRTAGEEPEIPQWHAVLLHTDRGPWQIAGERDSDDPDDDTGLFTEITTDLLVGSSVNGTAVGQSHHQCSGTLRVPVLISVPSATAIVAAFKPLIAKSSLPKTTTHRVEVRLDPGSMTLDVSEDPELVHDGRTVSVPLLAEEHAEKFPRKLLGMLTPDRTLPVDEPRSYGLGVRTENLEVLTAVSKRRKMPVAWYSHHQHRRVLVTVGRYYRVVFLPVELDEKEDQYNEPLAAVYDPGLPETGEDAEDQQPALAGV